MPEKKMSAGAAQEFLCHLAEGKLVDEQAHARQRHHWPDQSREKNGCLHGCPYAM